MKLPDPGYRRHSWQGMYDNPPPTPDQFRKLLKKHRRLMRRRTRWERLGEYMMDKLRRAGL